MGFAASEDGDLASQRSGELNDDVGRGAEAVEPNAISSLRSAQSKTAIADDACAQQRRSVFVREVWRDGVSEVFVDDRELGVAAVHVVACEMRVLAKIFEPTPT